MQVVDEGHDIRDEALRIMAVLMAAEFLAGPWIENKVFEADVIGSAGRGVRARMAAIGRAAAEIVDPRLRNQGLGAFGERGEVERRRARRWRRGARSAARAGPVRAMALAEARRNVRKRCLRDWGFPFGRLVGGSAGLERVRVDGLLTGIAP
jgi:hypothetical protein